VEDGSPGRGVKLTSGAALELESAEGSGVRVGAGVEDAPDVGRGVVDGGGGVGVGLEVGGGVGLGVGFGVGAGVTVIDFGAPVRSVPEQFELAWA
jgi:hypothetical protein